MKGRTTGATTLVLAIAAVIPGALSAQSLHLGNAIEAAFEEHPAIRAARARRESAVEGASAARARDWPTVGLQYGITHFQEPMITTPIHAFNPGQLPEFDETLLRGSLGVQYTVIDWGSRSSAIDGARTGVEIADAGVRAARIDLIEVVSSAYLRLATNRAVDGAADARVTALRAEVARARQGVVAGTAAEVEALRATTALQDAIAQKTATASGVELATRDLARVAGLPEEAVRTAQLDAPGDLDAPQSIAGSREANPRMAQAAGKAELFRAVVSGEKSGRLPRLDVTGGVMDYGTVADGHVFEWQLGAQLSWELFSGGGRSSAIRRAQAELTAAEEDLRATRLALEGQEDRASTAIESSDARVTALDTAVQQWEELVRIEALALEAGSGTQRDLLEAEAGLFHARAALVEAQAGAVQGRIRLAAVRGVLDLNWIESLDGRRP